MSAGFFVSENSCETAIPKLLSDIIFHQPASDETELNKKHKCYCLIGILEKEI